MKRINIYLLATIVFLLLIALPAYAQSPKITGYKTGNVTVNKSYSYRTVILDQSLEAAQESKSRVLEFGYKVDLDYIFKWEISTLMGEPVVVGWLAYKPTSISPYNSALLSQMFGNKDELFKKVRISEFKMEIVFFKNIKGQRAMERGAARVFDIGVAWIPFLGYSRDELMNDENLYKKFRSYNVPGSPDWNDLFNNIKNAQQAKQYFTDFTTTKRHIKPSPSDFKIVKVDIDTSEIDKYIYEYLQEIERNIVQEKTAGPKQEKALLEAKVARERQEMAAQMARQEEIDKASYAQKSFEDQLDDLLEEVEETDSAQDSALQMNHDKENARINFLANKIRETTNPLGKYSDENLREIYSNFDKRKGLISNLPRPRGTRIMKSISCEYSADACPGCDCSGYQYYYILDEDSKILAGPYYDLSCYGDICVGRRLNDKFGKYILINENLEEIKTDPTLSKDDYPHDFNGDFGLVSYHEGFLSYSVIDRNGNVLVKNGLGNMYDQKIVDGKICYTNGWYEKQYSYIYDAYNNKSYKIDYPGTDCGPHYNGMVQIFQSHGNIAPCQGLSYCIFDIESKQFIKNEKEIAEFIRKVKK